MKEIARLTAFILLITGTTSLLVNEFIFDWGSVGTLVFAVFNSLGIVILAVVYLRIKDGGRKKGHR